MLNDKAYNQQSGVRILSVPSVEVFEYQSYNDIHITQTASAEQKLNKLLKYLGYDLTQKKQICPCLQPCGNVCVVYTYCRMLRVMLVVVHCAGQKNTATIGNKINCLEQIKVFEKIKLVYILSRICVEFIFITLQFVSYIVHVKKNLTISEVFK